MTSRTPPMSRRDLLAAVELLNSKVDFAPSHDPPRSLRDAVAICDV